MEQLKGVAKIFLSKILGFLIFIIIIGICNILIPVINSNDFTQVMNFINLNFLSLVILTLFFLLGSIFFELVFPMNILGPVFNAIGSVFLINFLFELVNFLDKMLNLEMNLDFNNIKPIFTIWIILIVLVFGYIIIFVNSQRRGNMIRRPEKKRDLDKVAAEMTKAAKVITNNLSSERKEKKNNKKK